MEKRYEYKNSLWNEILEKIQKKSKSVFKALNNGKLTEIDYARQTITINIENELLTKSIMYESVYQKTEDVLYKIFDTPFTLKIEKTHLL